MLLSKDFNFSVLHLTSSTTHGKKNWHTNSNFATNQSTEELCDMLLKILEIANENIIQLFNLKITALKKNYMVHSLIIISTVSLLQSLCA